MYLLMVLSLNNLWSREFSEMIALRLQDVISRSGVINMELADKPQQTVKDEDVDMLLDIVVSWWDETDGWMGSPEDIASEILDEFPNHKITVELDLNAISYTVTGPRVNISCHSEISDLQTDPNLEMYE